MNNVSIKNNAIAIGILLLAVLIFCLPAIQGKVLSSHDYVSWQYMSKEAADAYKSQGGSIYWSNSQFGGMPSCTFHGGDSGNRLANLLLGANNSWPRPLAMFLVAMLSFYFLLSSLKLNYWVRVIGTVGFMLSSYSPIIAMAGHDTKHLAISLLAGQLGAIIYTFNGKRLLGLGSFALFSALLFTTGHYQIVYYGILMYLFLGVYLIINGMKTGNTKSVIINAALMLVIGGISILPNLQGIVLTKNYTNATMRGGKSELTLDKKDATQKVNGGLDTSYAWRWSNGIGETFSLMVPGLYGPTGARGEIYEGATAEAASSLGMPAQITQQLPDYWGPQPFLSGPVYFGATFIFLFILSLFVVKSKHKYWILAACIFFVFLSWGKHFEAFNYFLFKYLPGYNKFRTPSMALVIPQILVPMLGAWALNSILMANMSKEELFAKFKKAATVSLGLAVLVLIASFGFISYKGANDAELLNQLSKMLGDANKANEFFNAVKKDRASFANMDALKSLAYIAIAIAILFGYIKNKISKNIALLAIGLLCFIDVYSVSKRYFPEEAYLDKDEHESKYFAQRPVDAQILQDKDLFYRVHDISTDPFNDARPAYFHKLVGGYSPAKMEVYQDLIDWQISKNNKEVFNMLNTKYFIMGQEGNQQVMPNPEACGNAWFVNNIQVVNNANEEMLALNAPSLSDTSLKGNFVAKQTAILRKEMAKDLGATTFTKDSSAKITLVKYGLNEMNYKSNNANEGLAVFSDIYYNQGWKATIDGKEVPILKANYVLRALKIPTGSHDIKFVYEPAGAERNKGLAKMASLVVLLLFGAGLYMSSKKKEELIEEN